MVRFRQWIPVGLVSESQNIHVPGWRRLKPDCFSRVIQRPGKYPRRQRHAAAVLRGERRAILANDDECARRKRAARRKSVRDSSDETDARKVERRRTNILQLDKLEVVRLVEQLGHPQL